MTKKRFVKLIMSQGIQRNEANKIAESYNSRGFYYVSAYRNFIIKTSLRESFEILGEVVCNAAENLSRLICALKERTGQKMKIEIYQIGKVPPLTVIECDRWELDYQGIGDLTLFRDKMPIAVFLLNNIAGFKVISEDGEENGL